MCERERKSILRNRHCRLKNQVFYMIKRFMLYMRNHAGDTAIEYLFTVVCIQPALAQAWCCVSSYMHMIGRFTSKVFSGQYVRHYRQHLGWMQVYAHYLINYVSVGAENHAKRSHHLAVLLHSTIKPPAYRDVSFRLPVVMMKSRSDVKDQVYPSQNPNCRMVCV